jgi:hypothetical protein
MATELDAQYAALDKQVADARTNVRNEYQIGLDIAAKSGLTGGAARTFARQRPEYTFAKNDQQSLTEQRNAVDAQRRAATQVRTPYGTTQTEYYDPNTGESGTYISQQTPAGDKPVSQTAADVTPSQDPVPQEWNYNPSVTQSTPTQLPDIQLQEPDITPPAPQPSTADQPIPFISDETYLDPLYEPAPTSPTVGKLPTSPYDINQDGVVSDSEYLYGDDELYEPVPTDDELASIQEDLEFAAADAEFANLQTDVEWTEDFYLDNAEDLDEIAAKYGVDPTSPQAKAIWEQEYGADDDLNLNINTGTSAAGTSAPKPYTPELYKPRSIHDARSTVKDDDWRFRVQLSPYADYLYKAPNPGILSPLAQTDGVIFPYMPSITMTANATYNDYNPTHSNFRGAWYKASQQNDVIVNAAFTAQDVAEARYMLAAMHFFRSCTKMFYGQDNRRGSPPPLLYLNGLGEHQFNEHPCVLTFVTYTLPDNVDYIKTEDNALASYSPYNQDRTQAKGWSSWNSTLSRLVSSGIESLFGGGLPSLPDFSSGVNIFQTRNGATYVPTTLNLQLNFMPIQSRQQVSKEWSTREFANGNLLKKGYW